MKQATKEKDWNGMLAALQEIKAANKRREQQKQTERLAAIKADVLALLADPEIKAALKAILTA